MFPLQVIILMMVVLFYVGDEHRHAPLPGPPWMIVATVVASHVFLAALVDQATRRAARRLYEADVSTSSVTVRLDRVMSFARWGTVLLAVAQLWAGGWGTLVMAPPALTGGQSWGFESLRMLLVPQAVFLAAPVITWLSFWASGYRVESAVRARAMPYRLAMGLPTHEPPTRAQYVLMQSRHNFYFFVPMGVAAAVEAWAARYEKESPALVSLTTLASFGCVLGMLLLLPWIITKLWQTATMRGELRKRLDATAGKFRIRFSNILIWKTHSSVNNAAILGYLPFARYFLMTDALLESLTDRQIEAVFAHEVGHAYHKHIWWYAAAIVGALLLAGGLTAFLAPLWPVLPRGVSAYRGDIVSFLQLGMLAGFMVFGFSPISRRFEHQADWFAARHMAEAMGDGTPLRPDGITMDARTPLEIVAQAGRPQESGPADEVTALRRGAAEFSSALIQVVQISNRALDRGGWMHPSPLRRAALLDAMARSSSLAEKFRRRMVWTRLAIVGLVAVGALVAAGGVFVERLVAGGQP